MTARGSAHIEDPAVPVAETAAAFAVPVAETAAAFAVLVAEGTAGPGVR
jgi:hypothetical protein